MLGPPVVPFLTPFFGEGSPTKIDYRKGYPYSNLSTGGPSCGCMPSYLGQWLLLWCFVGGTHPSLHARIWLLPGCFGRRATAHPQLARGGIPPWFDHAKLHHQNQLAGAQYCLPHIGEPLFINMGVLLGWVGNHHYWRGAPPY